MTSWRMDNNKFWLGGRHFNTASPRLGTPTQIKARLQDGHPNATQGTFASWAPQRNARHVRKLGAPMHVRNINARHVRTSASWAPQRNERHIRKMVTQTQNSSATKGTSARWAPKRSTRNIRNFGAPMQCKARPQVGRPNALPQCKRKARLHVRKLGTPTQRKARPQDRHPNATQGASARWAPK
jgi:hypothetical protein